MFFSRPVMSDSLGPRGLQYTRPSFPSPSPGVFPSSRSLCQWCCPAISCSDTLFFFPLSFPGTFSISHLFALDDQNTGASTSASVLLVNIQGWAPLRFTGLILLSKGLLGVFSSTCRRHQFFGVLPSNCAIDQLDLSDIYRTPHPTSQGFPGGTVVKNLLASAGSGRDVGSIPGLRRSPGVGNGNQLQYSCLENPMDRGAWRLQSTWSQRAGHDWVAEHRRTVACSL